MEQPGTPIFSEEPRPAEPLEEEKRRKLRRYSLGVSVVMIVVCNAVFLAGLWWSGVNLDALVRTPDVYNPAKDICVRLSWHKVTGGHDPVKLCNEWINLSDPTGETHKFQKDTKVVQGADGKLYFDHGDQVDYRFFLLAVFVMAVIAGGMALIRYLIARYRIRLDMQGPTTS
jgi:hypothetical protein